ncbi:MAG: 3-dehydroquinate synthase, partial [Myxococcota bacterium]|nr:3-dehydroquinate synthase [Myxococcota bacterium]
MRSFEQPTRLVIAQGALARLDTLLPELPRRAVIIGDAQVSALYADALSAALQRSGTAVDVLSFAPGEASKCVATWARLLEQMAALELNRDALVLGLGGGVSLDLAGFVAATYLRGLRFVSVPSSLLAMVDAALGGKNGINLEAGKNLAGSFYPPSDVLIDPELLATLPAEELRAGLAELIKHAIIGDAALFERLETMGDKLGEQAKRPIDKKWGEQAKSPIDKKLGEQAKSPIDKKWGEQAKSPIDKKLLEPDAALIGAAIAVKQRVVACDPYEHGMRRVLNFGHTVAHALEKVTHYALSHGFAVSVGMAVESSLAKELCGFPEAERLRLLALLERAGLPTQCPVPLADALPYLRLDKKNSEHEIHCALPRAIGQMAEFGGRYSVTIPLETLERAWSACSPPPVISMHAPTYRCPSSKSLSQRALMIAALCEEPVELVEPLDCDDSRHLRKALLQMGVDLQENDDTSRWHVRGGVSRCALPSTPLHCGNAGTTLRFLAPWSLLLPGRLSLDGDAHMRKRPIGALVDALAQLGVRVRYTQQVGCPPLELWREGQVSAQELSVDASKSSQFASALMMVAPLLPNGLRIRLEGELVSAPYLTLTAHVMQAFGVEPTQLDARLWQVPPGRYQGRSHHIEGDWSAAAFVLVAGRLAGVPLRCPNCPDDSAQADRRIVDILASLDSDTEHHISLRDAPDLLPAVTIAALCARGPTRICDVRHARFKECDRIKVLARELRKLGAMLEEFEDGLGIVPGPLQP